MSLIDIVSLSNSFSSAYLAIGDASGIPPYRQCGVSGRAFALAQAPRVPLIYYSDGFHGYRKGFKLNYFVMNVSFAEGDCKRFSIAQKGVNNALFLPSFLCHSV